MMQETKWHRQPRPQRGIVLLLALLILLLIAAVAASMIFLAGMESTVVGSQRQSAQVFFAAQAGLEEAEARVLGSITAPDPTKLVGSAADLPTAVGEVIYIVAPGVNPTSAADPYFDRWYQDEFIQSIDTVAPAPALVASNQPVIAGLPRIPYMWVRITVKTEYAARADIDRDDALDDATPIYHDGRHELVGPPVPGDPQTQIVYRLTSLAELNTGARALLQREIGGLSLPALVVEGDFFISGNPTITGAAGAAHANGQLTLNGNPCVDEYFSADSTIVVSGNPTGPPCGGAPTPVDLRPNSDPLPVPDYDPANFRPTPGDARCETPNPACYVFELSGDVWRIDDGGQTWVGSGSNPTPEWNYTSPFPGGNGLWQTSGTSVLNGTYYFEGNVTIGSNPGSGPPANPGCQAPYTCPLEVTFIVEGSVDISGNPSMEPAGGFSIGNNPITILAGHDLKMNGNPGGGVTGYQGLYYAGDQFRLSGTAEVNGQMLVANRGDTDFPLGSGYNLLAPTDMGISGDASIHYDGGGGTIGLASISWREIRLIE